MGRVLIVGGNGDRAARLAAHPDLRDHEIAQSDGAVEALQSLRLRAIDVILINRDTPIGEDIALARELSAARPGVRIIVLASAATREDVIAALRARVRLFHAAVRRRQHPGHGPRGGEGVRMA